MQTLGGELDAEPTADIYKRNVALGLLYKVYISNIILWYLLIVYNSSI